MLTTEKTTLTQKGEIEVRIILTKPPFLVDVHTLSSGELYESVFTDSFEIPELKMTGKNTCIVSYDEANYVVICSPLQITVIVNPETCPEIDTGNKEIDRLANKYKSFVAKQQFARECSRLAEELEVPYTAVLSLKGNKSDCIRFKQSVESSISRGYNRSQKNMLRLTTAISEKDEVEAKIMLAGLKIYMGDTKTPVRLCEAVSELFTEALKVSVTV